MNKYIATVLAGDDANLEGTRADNVMVSENGMMSFVAMLAVLFFVVLLGLVGNVGLTVNQKIEVQNSADSTAYSSGLFIARGMNTVTATNHIIGELMALTVLHHALLGPEGDSTAAYSQKGKISSGERVQVSVMKAKLTFSNLQTSLFAIGNKVSKPTASYGDVSKGPTSREGATIFRSKLRLMRILDATLNDYSAGGYLQTVGFANLIAKGIAAAAALQPGLAAFYFQQANAARNIVGPALSGAAKLWDGKIAQEWKTLDFISGVAQGMSSLKGPLKLLMIAFYANSLRWAYAPEMTSNHDEILDQLGKRNGTTNVTYFGRLGFAAPLSPLLPVVREPASKQLSAIHKSQLIRATYPWVNYWRQRPLTSFRSLLRLSRAAHYYKHYTTFFTKTLAEDLKDAGVNLLILRELDLAKSDKGQEPWTRLPQDELRYRLFTNVGFSRRDRPVLVSSGFFHEENDDGFVAYSQAIVYNANKQIPNQTPPRRQPRVAWDTLNWTNPVIEYRLDTTPESASTTSDPPTDEPRIFINWRTKLVPVTRLQDASQSIPAEFRGAVKRLPLPESAQFRTH